MTDGRRTFKTFTLRERPELEGEFERLATEGWPVFLRQRDALGLGAHWPALFGEFADWQVLVCDSFDRVVAAGHGVPLTWDGTPADLPDSIAAILARALATRGERRRPTALSALAALVDARHRGLGLSRVVLESMLAAARRWSFAALVAPVRPTLKSAYPLVAMERYVEWRDEEDLPIDPWMRVHARLGAEILRVIPRALVIVGRVAEWEKWTAMSFPDSGAYVVPGALQPVAIDRETDEGRYEDPNVWMRHPLRGT